MHSSPMSPDLESPVTARPCADGDIVLDFANSIVGGFDQSFVVRLVKTAMRDYHQRMPALLSALAGSDLESIENLAHYLKNTATSFGGHPLATVLQTIEHAVRSGDLADATRHAGRLRYEADRFEAAILAYTQAD